MAVCFCEPVIESRDLCSIFDSTYTTPTGRGSTRTSHQGGPLSQPVCMAITVSC